MLKTRTINGQRKFYESSTGITENTIQAVSFQGHDNLVVTVVNKDGEPHIYLPFRTGNPLVKLVDAIEKMDLVITKVA